MSDMGTPQLYILQMDSSYNLRNNEPQVYPLHILSKAHQKHEVQSQWELLIDVSGDSATKVDKNYQEKQYLTTNLDCVSSKNLKGDSSETDLLTSSLINSSHELNEIDNKVQQIQNYVHISDRSVPPRAVAVLPNALQIRRKDVISPRRPLPPRTRFGPVHGVKRIISNTDKSELVLSAIANKTPLFLTTDKDGNVIHIDVSDKDKSNWIGLLPLGDENTANLWIYEENNELYAITTEAVPSRKALMLGYSKKYLNDYELIGPSKDILAETSLNQKSWWCYECQRAMPSAIHLQRHIDADHEEDTPVSKRVYRCRHCSRTFSRIFTLRRHVSLHCEKKFNKSNNVTNTETAILEPTLNSTLNSEDNRVPSDESFQNYSNGLDFSTNLFDTDRMPGLDISGNSRSEVFNPYGLDSECTFTNDLGYTNGCTNKTDILSNNDNEKKHQAKNTTPPLELCTYCNQNVAKGKKRQHVSKCPARRFECECKKVFSNKKLLAQHIYTAHSADRLAAEQRQEENTAEDNIPNTTETESQNTTAYTCEQCQHTFKRRGMLVNHLWRVHGAGGARVPLARRVRHYPCGACHKLYRAAAKRDRHAARHHPGLEQARAKPMEGGTRLCAPAVCGACPRQYATRAKLLQHQRCHHPHLVPPPPKKNNITQKTTHMANDISDASEETAKNKASLQQLLSFY